MADKEQVPEEAPNKADIVAGLLEERRGYEVRGLKDRASDVNKTLGTYGVKGDKLPDDIKDDPALNPAAPDVVPAVDELETTDGAPSKKPATKAK